MDVFDAQGLSDLDEGESVAPRERRKARPSRREVRIDALADSVCRHVDHAIVCIDVLLSSTTVATSLSQGRRTVLAATVEEARVRGRALARPLYVSEPGLPGADGPDFRGGVLALESREGKDQDVVVVSPTAQILQNARSAPAVYVACLRNMSATAALLAERHDRVTLVGAGHGAEIRSEDQMVAAWIARKLFEHGFEASGLHTAREVERWGGADLSLAALGRGAEHLRRAGWGRELELVMSRIDDLDFACSFESGELVGVRLSSARLLTSH
jgi:phosphosulfolactate phosphohydrolase-like enzyme